MLLSQPSECWDSRRALPCPATFIYLCVFWGILVMQDTRKLRGCAVPLCSVLCKPPMLSSMFEKLPEPFLIWTISVLFVRRRPTPGAVLCTEAWQGRGNHTRRGGVGGAQRSGGLMRWDQTVTGSPWRSRRSLCPRSIVGGTLCCAGTSTQKAKSRRSPRQQLQRWGNPGVCRGL